MSLATVYSRAQQGVKTPLITVEVHMARGLPGLSIVGLPETAVKESKDRVRATLVNSRFDFPIRRITVNLAPADLPKEGCRFDLAIAVGILAASGQLDAERVAQYEFLGELALDGALRAVHGVLPAALQCRQDGRRLFCPAVNRDEAGLAGGASVYGAQHLLQVCAHLTGRTLLPPIEAVAGGEPLPSDNDLDEIRGQRQARRALEVAAAGEHSLLMIGPPGTGKTMLASRLPGLLPPMTETEALETAAVVSSSHQPIDYKHWRQRPFRAPHHTASAPALVGGGSIPRPGEISLAHQGVLFLDELPEFDRRVLEVLREPLESGRVTISRAGRQAEFPARFQLVAAMNPCPCGYLGDTQRACRCTPDQVQRYHSKISGPLLDRIDLQIMVPRLSCVELLGQHAVAAENSATVRERVIAARRRQHERAGRTNAQLTNRQVEQFCNLSETLHLMLAEALEKLKLSARAYHKVLKTALTIADLDQSDSVEKRHITEALTYRSLEAGTSSG